MATPSSAAIIAASRDSDLLALMIALGATRTLRLRDYMVLPPSTNPWPTALS